MRTFQVACGLAAAWLATFAADASRAALLKPTDPIIAIDIDAPTSASSYPSPGETPSKAFDNAVGTKYLNFGGNVARDIGVIITPAAGSTVVKSMRFTTANDAEVRDPASWKLLGTNSPITTLDNGSTPLEPWTLISQGAALLPSGRGATGPVYSFPNATGYSSYQILIPDVKNVGAANSMQVAEIGLFTSNDGSGASVLTATDPVVAFQLPISRAKTPDNEAVAKVIDGLASSKYLNFSKENCGFIVTPSAGPTVVRSFQIITANDAEARDPATWALYGTVDPITSAPFSDGSSEDWTLIASGNTSLPAARGAAGPMTTFSNSIAYRSYRMVFPTLKNSGGANSMQIAEFNFFVPEPSSIGLALACTAMVAGLRRRARR